MASFARGNASAAPGLIFLQPRSLIVEDTLKKLLSRDEPEPIDVRGADFDDVSYRIAVDPTDTQSVSVSVAMPCMDELQQLGVDKVL